MASNSGDGYRVISERPIVAMEDWERRIRLKERKFC